MTGYIHGTAPEEQERLSLLNRLMNEAALRELRLSGGERIADFGSGLGQLTRAMARAAGVRVVGVERSEEQIAEALRQARAAGEEALLELRRGEVESPPLEEGAFDLAHARFVLEHVPDPLAVVRQMVRAVRPGGRIVLQDDDHDVLRVWPEPLGFGALWRAYARTYDRLGCDPFIGRRLVSLLHAAGVRPVRATFLFFGACAGEPLFRGFAENMTTLLAAAREPIVSGGLLDGASFDGAIDQLRLWANLPDATLWYPIFWAEGVR